MKPQSIVLLLAVLPGACAADSHGTPGAAASSTAPAQILFALSRDGGTPAGELWVYDTGHWRLSSQTACRSVKGDVTEPQLSMLRAYVADPALAKLPETCSDPSSFTMWIGGPHNSIKQVCWDTLQSSLAPGSIAGLTSFFEERMADLAWDGQVKDCPRQGPPAIDVSDKPIDPASQPAPQR